MWVPSAQLILPNSFLSERKVICPRKFSLVGVHPCLWVCPSVFTCTNCIHFPVAVLTLTKAKQVGKGFLSFLSYSLKDIFYRGERRGVGEGGEARWSHCLCIREAGSEQKSGPGCKTSKPVPRTPSSSKDPAYKSSLTFPTNTPAGDYMSNAGTYGGHCSLTAYHQSTPH